MKAAIDSVDFGLAIEQCPQHGFPVIRDCTLGGSVELEASLELDDNGAVAKLALRPLNQSRPVFSFDKMALPADREERRQALATQVKTARRLVQLHATRLPKSPVKRRALESFLALA